MKSTLDSLSWLTYSQLSAALNVNISTLYSLVRRDLIPHHRLGPRLVRFSPREIEAWLAQCERRADLHPGST